MSCQKRLIAVVTTLALLHSFHQGADASPVITASTQEPELQQIADSRKKITGEFHIKLDGAEQVLLTVSEKQEVNQAQLDAANPKLRETLLAMAAKSLEGASVGASRVSLRIGIKASDSHAPGGPEELSQKDSTLEMGFELDRETLALLPARRNLLYGNPHYRLNQRLRSQDFEVELTSITKLPNHALALEGKITAQITKNRADETLPKPVTFEATFKIFHAPATESALKLLGSAK